MCVASERVRGLGGRSCDHVLEQSATPLRAVLNSDGAVLVLPPGKVLSGGGTRPEYDKGRAELHRLRARVNLSYAAVQFASNEAGCVHVLR